MTGDDTMDKRTLSRRQAVIAASATLAVVGATGGAAARAAPIRTPQLKHPLAGRKLGVAAGGYYDANLVDRFVQSSGARVSYCLPVFSDVADGLSGDRLAAVNRQGFTPEVTWQPRRATVTAIAAGEWDRVLQQSARFTAHIPIRIRFGHEMNGTWNRSSSDHPAAFVGAWRRVHSIFQDAGNHAEWVWTPNVLGKFVRAFEPFYPGDDVCDLVGLDGYANRNNEFRSFERLFDDGFDRLRAITDRDLTVGEVGVARNCPDRAAWITHMFSWLVAHPDVPGLTWWNRDQYSLTGDKPASRAFGRGFNAWAL